MLTQKGGEMSYDHGRQEGALKDQITSLILSFSWWQLSTISEEGPSQQLLPGNRLARDASDWTLHLCHAKHVLHNKTPSINKGLRLPETSQDLMN